MQLSSTKIFSFLCVIPSTYAFIPSSITTPASSSLHHKFSRATKLQVKGKKETPQSQEKRRAFLQSSTISILSLAGIIVNPTNTVAVDESATGEGIQDSMDINDFLRTGIDSGGPMGVSSQAGKSRPQTGVFFRDGTDVARDKRTGSVSAEIIVGTKSNPSPLLVNYVSPWPLATGSVYDIECRDSKTGDGAFVSVVLDTSETKGKSIQDLSNDFFVQNLFSPTGRFSFYGSPTNIKVVKNTMLNGGEMRKMELSFSNLSQSTQTELPRKAMVTALIPKNTDNVVMLVASAAASRWKKDGVKDTVISTVESFRVAPSPKSNLKVRVKQRGEQAIF